MPNKKKLYYLPTYGQLGNHLSVLAHLVAFALEYDYKIIFFRQDYLCKILKSNNLTTELIKFSKLPANSFFSFCLNKAIIIAFFNRNKRLFKRLFINQPFYVDTDLNVSKLPRTIAVTNWMFRYYNGVVKHQTEIRKRLMFDESLFSNAKQILKNLNLNFPSYILIGIHVRKGDYATWLDGKFFYDNEIYYAKLKEIAAQLEKCVFIICSNEQVQFDNQASLNIIYANGSPAEDIFLLSKCSYIVGPPSTFSSYAAFLGDQNLLLLESKDEDVTLSRFRKFYIR